MQKQLKVCWISAGVSSFIAGYLEKETIDKFVYVNINDQHEDSFPLHAVPLCLIRK